MHMLSVFVCQPASGQTAHVFGGVHVDEVLFGPLLSSALKGFAHKDNIKPTKDQDLVVTTNPELTDQAIRFNNKDIMNRNARGQSVLELK